MKVAKWQSESLSEHKRERESFNCMSVGPTSNSMTVQT